MARAETHDEHGGGARVTWTPDPRRIHVERPIERHRRIAAAAFAVSLSGVGPCTRFPGRVRGPALRARDRVRQGRQPAPELLPDRSSCRLPGCPSRPERTVVVWTRIEERPSRVRIGCGASRTRRPARGSSTDRGAARRASGISDGMQHQALYGGQACRCSPIFRRQFQRRGKRSLSPSVSHTLCPRFSKAAWSNPRSFFESQFVDSSNGA